MTNAQLPGHPDDLDDRLAAVDALARDESVGAISGLIEALADPGWRVRQAAVAELARRGGAEVLAAVLTAMRAGHRDLGVLNGVLQVLGRSGVDTLAPLVHFLTGPDVELRAYAALALGAHGDPRAVPALIQALDDPDRNVRFHVIEALKELRAGEAVESLTALVESRDFSLAYPALDALASVGDPRIAHRVVPLLRDEWLQAAAIDALAGMGDEEAIGPLASLLDVPEAPAGGVARALTAIRDRYEKSYRKGEYIIHLSRRAVTAEGVQTLVSALEHADGADIRALAVVLGWLEGPTAEGALARLLDRSTARDEVLEALVRRGPDAIPLLTRQFDADDLATRQAAAHALGQIGDARALPALVDALGAEEELGIVAAGSLAMIGDARAYAPLLSLLGQPHAGLRRAVVSALNSLGREETPADMERLLTDPDPLVRESAVRVAGYAGFPECADLLLERCRDADETVRRTAVEHLPYLDDPRVIAALGSALQHPSPGTRAAAARALGQTEAAIARPALLAALNDADPWVRYFAARSAGRLKDAEALPTLARLVESDAAVQVRVAAVEAIGGTGAPAGVPVLAPLVASDNPDLARAALTALAALAHPDALPPLLSAVRSSDPRRRAEAARALGDCGQVEAVEMLHAMATTELDPDVVRTAILALERLALPEAIDALVAVAALPKWRESCMDSLSRLKPELAPFVARGLRHRNVNVRRVVVEALTRMRHPGAAELLRAAEQDSDGSIRLLARIALTHASGPEAVRRRTSSGGTNSEASRREGQG